MNWLVLILSFSVALAVGAFVATLLERRRADWGYRHRLVVASLALPAFVVLATVAGVVVARLTASQQGEGNRDLISAVLLLVGAIFCLITLLGSTVGAVLAARKLRR